MLCDQLGTDPRPGRGRLELPVWLGKSLHEIKISRVTCDQFTTMPNDIPGHRLIYDQPAKTCDWRRIHLRVTLTNNRAPFIWSFKLCASFHCHWWIQTGVTVRKRPISVKIDDFLAVWPWNLMDDLGTQQDTSSLLHQALCIISNPSVNSNWSCSPEALNSGQNWWFLCPVWPWNLTDDFEKQ